MHGYSTWLDMRAPVGLQALAASGNTHVPALGTALPVTFHDSHRPPSLPKRGAWIKLQAVAAWVIQGQLQVSTIHYTLWYLSMRSASTLEVLPALRLLLVGSSRSSSRCVP